MNKLLLIVKYVFSTIVVIVFWCQLLYSASKICYIRYSSKGGIGTMEKQECVKGSNVRLNPCTYTKEEYYFRCWEDDFGRQYTDQEYVTVESDMHLYAVWSKIGDENDPTIKKNTIDQKVILSIKEYQKQRDLSDEIRPNKWYTVGDNKWYYIDCNLLPQRGWHEEMENNKSRWYYLDSETCLMALGWKVVDKKYYYFATESIEADYVFDKVSGSFVSNGKDKELGQLYIDEYTPDGRYVSNQGVMVD